LSSTQVRRAIAGIHRVWTGAQWAEGPTWSNEGQYLVFSNVSGNTLYRYIWDDGRVTVFRRPSSNANGNAFDYQGRLLTCEDFTRRLVRWEHDGTMTVIADSYDGKPLNSPNGVAAHPDGSVWFTDPGYGDQLAEGHPDEAGGPSNPKGILNPRIGAPDAGVIGGRKRELPTNTYRWDPSGKLEVVVPVEGVDDALAAPPGVARPLAGADQVEGPVIGRKAEPVRVGDLFDLDGAKLSSKRLFTDMMVDGVKCMPDDMCADVHGNLWCGSNAPLGYAGVLVFDPAGKLIGRIRLPEACANLTFGGPKRDRLFMAASQPLYMLETATQGAAPG